MKISLNWLRELVELPAGIDWKEIARRLTQAGLEVEGVTHAGAGLSGAIVAEVRGRRPHPKADKLTLVDVFDGETVTQVVCGAPNVPAPGDPGRSPRVVWARPGATLPGGLTLSTREVRGIPSPGMLCAEDELGLSEDHGGILLLSPEDGLAIGSDFGTGAGLPDAILELNVTPNRADCLGHVGVAREVAALFAEEGARLRLPEVDLRGHLSAKPAPDLADLAAVEVRDAAGCPRYTARVIRGVRVGRSPLPVRLRLQLLGVRALSTVVDATNLALLEWGQPLHAFDLSRLRGRRIIVRRAGPGEALTTLDGNRRELSPEDLLIADAERGVALAGVMGGRDSEVAPETTELLLESACFDPLSVRRSARRHRLHTEASHRFERGVDPNEGVVRASDRCTQLILQLSGQLSGQLTGQLTAQVTGGGAPEIPEVCDLIDVYPQRRAPLSLSLRPGRTRLLLGSDVPDAEQAQLLHTLGFKVQAPPDHPDALQDLAHVMQALGREGAGETQLTVTVPTYRQDLTREVDLIEEIGRLRGYDRIVPRLPVMRMGQVRPAGDRTSAVADRACDLCAALGLDEIQTYSFVAREQVKGLGFGAGDRRATPLMVHNPLREELGALRTQVVIGLLGALRHNLSHGQGDVRIFEVAEVFWARDEGQPEERTRVAGVLCGHRDTWLKAGPQDELDIFDVRGVVEPLLAGLGLSLVQAKGDPGGQGPGGVRRVLIRAAQKGEVPWLHPGVAAVVADAADDTVVGEFGEVHPDLRRRLGIETRAFAFELDLPLGPPPLRQFVPLPRYPEVTRDLSFFVAAAVPAGELVAVLLSAGEPLLTAVHVVEDYREPGKVPAGKKGLLLTLTYRSLERTLTDDEVRKAHEQVVNHLRAKVPVDLR